MRGALEDTHVNISAVCVCVCERERKNVCVNQRNDAKI